MSQSLIRKFTFLFLIILLSSCSSKLKHKVKDEFFEKKIQKLLIADVQSDRLEVREGARELLFDLTGKALIEKGYEVFGFQDGEGLDIKKKIKKKDIEDILNDCDCDGLLTIRYKTWKETSFITYVSFKTKVEYKLYSKEGELLWKALYKQKDSDLRLHKEPVEYALIKAFEPTILRIVSASIFAMPNPVLSSSDETFFQWLP